MAIAAPPGPSRALKPIKRKLQLWLLTGLLIFMLAVAILAALGANIGGCSPSAPPTNAAKTTIPPALLGLYSAAEQRYGVPWSVLAAINSIESGFGANLGPSSAGALGPMQFLASTWRHYGVDGNADGRTDIMDPRDAIPAAARLLRANGAPDDMQRALFSYNHAQWYVDKVLALAATFADPDGVGAVACAAPTGHAALQQAIALRSPRQFKLLPADLVAPGYRAQPIDARIWPNAVWLLRTYGLRVTAAREGGHQTHGDGTALDMIPAAGRSQAAWDASAGRMATDLGWTAGCAPSGTRPVCALVPAIQFIGYDGYANHGSPRSCHAGCAQHIHVSWVSDSYGAYPGGLGPPPAVVSVFPIGPRA